MRSADLVDCLDLLAGICRSLMQRTEDYDKSDRSKMEIEKICKAEDLIQSYKERY